MNMFQEEPDITPEYLSMLLEKLDDDIATRLVASAFSMDKQKLTEAIATACREMEIREQNRTKQHFQKHQQQQIPQEIELDLSELEEYQQNPSESKTIPVISDEKSSEQVNTEQNNEGSEKKKEKGGFLNSLFSALEPYLSSSKKKT